MKTFAWLLSALAVVTLGGGCSQTDAASRRYPVSRSDSEWRRVLSPEQYEVLRKGGTERAFSGAHHAAHDEARYLCAGCGQPLFGSEDKFDSGTGWPSFTRALRPDTVHLEDDTSLGMTRTEVRCARCGGHLGHVFDDGPAPTGKRYCINSVALAKEPRPMGKALFAGGCFWCLETAFEGQPGVAAAVSGYTGGHVPNPTYEQVGAGRTGHAEAVEVSFDPSKISYERLLEIFWRNVDPLSADGQFCDRGSQYRAAIFYLDEAQHRAALASRQALEKSHGLAGRIVTQIVAGSRFYPAEEYHQDFYEKDPVRYRSYREACGRDRRLRELWGDSPRH